MKILINAISQVSAGTFVTTQNLLLSLDKLENDFQYIVIIPAGFGFEKLDLGTNFQFVKIKRQRIWYFFYRLYFDNYGIKRTIKRYKPDLYLALGNIGPALLPVPQVVFFHHPFYIDFESSNFSLNKKIRNKIELFFFSRTVKNTDIFVVENDYVKERLEKIWGFPQRNIRVIANALPVTLNCRERISHPSQFKDFLFVSRYYPHKNHQFLIEVAKRIKEKKISDIRLITTINEKILEGKKFLLETKRLGLNSIIHNIGEINHSDLSDWYCRCTALFFPSLLESFGMPLIEAMAFRKPVLVADLPYAHSVCKNAAAYFDPHDSESALNAIQRILIDEDWKNKLISNGSEVLEHYSDGGRIAKDYTELFKEVHENFRTKHLAG